MLLFFFFLLLVLDFKRKKSKSNAICTPMEANGERIPISGQQRQRNLKKKKERWEKEEKNVEKYSTE